MARNINKKKNNGSKDIVPFALKDCALVAIATGKRAQNLRELRDMLATIHAGSIYYHFWGGRLRMQFDEPEFNNDFSAWSNNGLHDSSLAERLGAIVPTDFNDLEDLRHELIEVIEERLDETEIVPWSKADQQFQFIRSQIVVFDTHQTIHSFKELAEFFPKLSIGSIFYHFIDAQRRYPFGMDDFSNWLTSLGNKYLDLVSQLTEIDPYFSSLSELRQRLSRIFSDYLEKSNI